MRFSLSIVACLLGLGTANFDLYIGDDNAVGAEPYPMWQIFEADPDCRDVYNTEMNPDLDDVSGDKRGVRCEGRGCHRNEVNNIDVFEMHFSNKPLFHFSYF
jgi:hypothetical protein